MPDRFKRGIMGLPMTAQQEEALYDFLDSSRGSFEIDDVLSYIIPIDSHRMHRLKGELESFISFRNLAFPLGGTNWMSRRAFFEPLPFIISPSRLELLNGILIPGHRCVPFANTALLPQELHFFWQGTIIPGGTTEGAPEEFYPYYCIFGEEFAPQYLARDNAGNHEAYSKDPFDDPPEVSISTLDMRSIYRESSFVPGDSFIVRTISWVEGIFELEKLAKDTWSREDLAQWCQAAQEGFEQSFAALGPASCTEEQITYAYWHGSPRMRELPALSLEEFFYKETSSIETVPYGIETRFWYAGREIPDRRGLDMGNTRPDKTPVEEVLSKLKLPITEYVIHSYVRDALYRGELEISMLLQRLVPPGIEAEGRGLKILTDCVQDIFEEIQLIYSPFKDKVMGPIRYRAGELHTAVIDLAAQLSRSEMDPSWLPRHTFIILSQIQTHTVSVMEELDADDFPATVELDVLDGSLDSMIETYEDLKELIEEAQGTYRRNKLALVRPGSLGGSTAERLIQLSIGGIDIWRRIILPEETNLHRLHQIIQAAFGWRNTEAHSYRAAGSLDGEKRIIDLVEEDILEFAYEYGSSWTVRVMIFSGHERGGSKPVRCVAGSGMAPPEFIEGPLKFKRVLYALENGNEIERQNARQELGSEFENGDFDLETCNRNLNSSLIRGLFPAR